MTTSSLTSLLLAPAPDVAGWLTAACGATLLLLAAFAIGRALRRTSAARRHLVLTAGLVAAGLLPLAMAAMPWHLPLLPHVPSPRAATSTSSVGPTVPTAGEAFLEAAPEGATTAAREETAGGETSRDAAAGARTGPGGRTSRSGAVTEMPAPGRTSEVVDRVEAPGAWPAGATGARILGIIWLLGAAAVMGWIFWGTLRLSRLRRRASVVHSGELAALVSRIATRIGVERPVRILASEDVDVPMATGLWRPAILLPRGASEEWSRERLKAVLAHEMGHIRRLDILSHLANRLACAVHWYNPLTWLASRRARREGERACDDLALTSGTRPSAYARTLLELARSARPAGRRGSPAVGLPMARPGDLEGRILAVLEDATDRRPATTRTVLGALLPALGLVLLFSASTAAPGEARAPAPEGEAAGAPADATVATPGAPPEGTPSADSELLLRTLADLLEDPHAGVRAAAAASLGKRRVAGAVPALIDALEDPVAKVRKHAAGALGRIEDPVAVGSLSDRLLNDREPRVRRVAAWALGEMESAEAVGALEAALSADLSPKLRAEVVEALGESKRPGAVRILEGLLEGGDPDLRRTALEALVKNGTPRAFRSLVAAMRNPDPEIRRAAADALGEEH